MSVCLIWKVRVAVSLPMDTLGVKMVVNVKVGVRVPGNRGPGCRAAGQVDEN